MSSEGVHNLLAENSSEVGPDGVIPFAPMMSFQKYLTMQVCAFCRRPGIRRQICSEDELIPDCM